jgi:hypothetical protein
LSWVFCGECCSGIGWEDRRKGMKKCFTGYYHNNWYKKQCLCWVKDWKLTKLIMPDLIKHKAVKTKNGVFGYLYPVKVKITIESE